MCYFKTGWWNVVLYPVFLAKLKCMSIQPHNVILWRTLLLAIGVPLLFLLHVLDLVAHFPMYFYGSEFARFVVYSIGVGGVAVPFIIWFVVCYKSN